MAQLPQTKHSIIELENRSLTFCFNLPQKTNALSEDLIKDIQNVFEGDDEYVSTIKAGKNYFELNELKIDQEILLGQAIGKFSQIHKR